MPKSIRKGLSDDDDDTQGSVQPPQRHESRQASLLNETSATVPPAASAASRQHDEEAPFEAEEAAAVKPEKALLQPTLSSLASGGPSYFFADEDESSSLMPAPESKKKIWKARNSKVDLVGITETKEEEKARSDSGRAIKPGATAVGPSGLASSSQASLSTSSSSAPRPASSKLRPQTVFYVDGERTTNDEVDDMDHGDIGRASPPPHLDMSFATSEGSYVVASEVMNADPDAMEERIRQSILDKAIKAEVVNPDDEDDEDTKSGEPHKNRWLYIGTLLLLAMVAAIIVIVVLVVRQQGGDSTRDREAAGFEANRESSAPSQGPIKTSQPTGPTSSPTTMAFLESEESLIAHLGPAVNTEELRDTVSPHHKAFQWLLKEDRYSPVDNVELVERYVLTLFYYATGGPQWTDQLHFLSTSVGHCLWGHLNETVDLPAIDCNDDSMLTDIVLEQLGLEGTIPSEVQYLSELIVLGLDSNSLTGTIPSEIGLLSGLTELDIASNEIKGTIPSSLFDLVDLKYLVLEFNGLSGTIPSNIGNCVSLKYFDLEQTKLTGTVPEEVSTLASLEAFITKKVVGLSGPLPSFSMNRNLRDLDLGGNSFGSTIPVTIFDNKKLVWLDLFENKLTGIIPTEATQMPELTFINLYDNLLTGTIPRFNGTPKLKVFDVEINQLTGEINGILNGSAPMLEEVWLNNNQLTGTIPDAIGSHQSLAFLYLHDDELNGTLPTTLGLLTKLEDFSVSSNAFTGTVPSELGLLTKLMFMDVCCNFFTGTLPTEWSALSNLELLYMEENEFTGTLPPASSWNATTFPNMQVFWSHKNNFTGDISPGFCDSGDFQSSIEDLGTDCLGEIPEVNCTCCKACCDSNDVCEGFE